MKESSFFCAGADEVIKRISENSKDYTHAYLDTYPLSSEQVHALAGAIEHSNHLTYLNIYDCHLNMEQLGILLHAVQNNHSITDLVINKDIGPDLYSQFMKAVELPGNTKESLTQKI